jgi:hypothetical protein
MWTLILIISFSSSVQSASYGGAAIDHIDGFRTESACVEASRKIARERKDNSLKMYCVRTDERGISP